MRKKIGLAVLGVVLLVSGYLIMKGVQKVKDKEKAGHLYQQMPELKFSFVKPLDLNNNKPVILNYFSPDCDHCQYMAKQLVVDSIKLSETNFVMITKALKSDCKDFINEYRLDSLSFLGVAVDTSGYFVETFKSGAVPSFYVYDAERKLAGIIKGETKVENILTLLKPGKR